MARSVGGLYHTGALAKESDSLGWETPTSLKQKGWVWKERVYSCWWETS